MEFFKEFFSNTFFTIVISLSALVALIVYFYRLQYRIKVKLIRQRHWRAIADLKNHHIVCGSGRVGQKIIQEIKRLNQSLIVIDKEEEQAALCHNLGALFIHGDASKDEAVLQQAGIERAKSIFVMVDEDIDSAFITGSARKLNKGIFIVSRVSEQTDVKEIKKLGADITVDPTELGEPDKAVKLIEAVL